MKRLEVKISDEEAQILEEYCKQSEKTRTDVIRSYIRQLKRKVKKRCAGMGGLQQTAINCGKQNIKPEKSPLSTPGEVSSPKERAPREVSKS